MLPAVFTKNKKNDALPDLTNLITIDEDAQDLGFHVNHIRPMVRRGDLTIKPVGRMIFISSESIKVYKDKTRGFDKHAPR
jgi:hypothetical protein